MIPMTPLLPITPTHIARTLSQLDASRKFTLMQFSNDDLL